MVDAESDTPERALRLEIAHLRELLAAERARADAEHARAEAERDRADALERLAEVTWRPIDGLTPYQRADLTTPGHVEVPTDDWALTCEGEANPPDAWTRWEPGREEPGERELLGMDDPPSAGVPPAPAAPTTAGGAQDDRRGDRGGELRRDANFDEIARDLLT